MHLVRGRFSGRICGRKRLTGLFRPGTLWVWRYLPLVCESEFHDNRVSRLGRFGMTTRIAFRCSAVLAILVVVATAGNLWAGEWLQTFGPEDFAPDPGWDTYIYGYPEENTVGA